MANHQIYIIFVILISAQIIFSKPAHISSDAMQSLDDLRNNASASEILKLFTIENLLILPRQHAANAANATQYMLKDESLKAHNESEVLEFKRNLTQLIDKYDPLTTNMITCHKTMDHFANITNRYLHLPEDKVTGASKYIIELLDKYNCGKIAMSVNSHYELFFENFMKQFEESKQDLEKPLLDWYEQFTNSNNFAEKIAFIIDFILLF